MHKLLMISSWHVLAAHFVFSTDCVACSAVPLACAPADAAKCMAALCIHCPSRVLRRHALLGDSLNAPPSKAPLHLLGLSSEHSHAHTYWSRMLCFASGYETDQLRHVQEKPSSSTSIPARSVGTPPWGTARTLPPARPRCTLPRDLLRVGSCTVRRNF